MHILRIDHLVLTVTDIDRTVAFYRKVLGMDKEVFAAGRVALRFGDQKINLHESGSAPEPRAARPLPGSADFCLLTDIPLEEAMTHVRRCGVQILLGPVRRTGAEGGLLSFYFRDPDGNLIEVSNKADP